MRILVILVFLLFSFISRAQVIPDTLFEFNVDFFEVLQVQEDSIQWYNTVSEGFIDSATVVITSHTVNVQFEQFDFILPYCDVQHDFDLFLFGKPIIYGEYIFTLSSTDFYSVTCKNNMYLVIYSDCEIYAFYNSKELTDDH